jgi:hypothetical protein
MEYRTKSSSYPSIGYRIERRRKKLCLAKTNIHKNNFGSWSMFSLLQGSVLFSSGLLNTNVNAYIR